MAPAWMEYLPLPQAMQSAESDLPESANHLPATQSSQTSDPIFAWCLPSTHRLHVGPPLSPDEPAMHVQAVAALLSGGAVEYAGHAAHVVAPIVAEYVPVIFLFFRKRDRMSNSRRARGCQIRGK